ncbi:hypothetical protein [Saccharothrix coeruleofusca]|uniref:Lipoprotein n=1 Tax=Saccharothrix coeruleofusca TaxID=33919 RepID=A0A918EFD6_9PSEU|nr:hypothetical protein [Saccharothrix coeruleofusca]MBP2335287.1 hypothetical protein [Saccharothrix coeruleofusca]GGP71978.1 hypothetical protein GCM10010185_51670 [Saccharothrix coeruleofusca]
MVRSACLSALLAVSLAVGGCASASRDLAQRAAEEFEAAVASGRPERVCELLTERAREGVDCSSLELPRGEVREVVVWGDAARVRTDDDTLFLRELSSGWRVSGAGCHAVHDRPYECEVGGP